MIRRISGCFEVSKYLLRNYNYCISGKKHTPGKAALKRSRDKTKLRRKLRRKLLKIQKSEKETQSQTCNVSQNSEVIIRKLF